MATVSPDSPSTPKGKGGGAQRRLPLRWAFIVLVTAAAGIGSFAAGGSVADSVAAATAVAAVLHSMLE